MPEDTGAMTQGALVFDTDRGASRSTWMAIGLIVLIVAWMGSGFILPSEEAPVEAATEVPPVTVGVIASQSEPVTQVFVAEGQALPDRETLIRAEVTGEVAEVLVKKGDLLEAGQVIARFDAGQTLAELERAKENLRVAQREFDNAEALRKRGAATADRVSQAQATLAAAEADVTAAENNLDDTQLNAPFAGLLDRLDLDEGEFVSAGTDVASVIDTSPLTVVVQVPQQGLAALSVGQIAEVRFITGQTVPGKVVFIGARADAETRTFRAEVEIANENNEIPAGLSAQVRVPTGERVAHFISPAVLSLGTDGTLGVKTVADDNTVVFNEIEIVRAQTDGLWIAGLPDQARIITIGQGFVTDGETVDAKPDEDLVNTSAGQ